VICCYAVVDEGVGRGGREVEAVVRVGVGGVVDEGVGGRVMYVKADGVRGYNIIKKGVAIVVQI